MLPEPLLDADDTRSTVDDDESGWKSAGNDRPGRRSRLRRSPAAPTTTGVSCTGSSSPATTSATTHVTLSGAPASSAASTSAVTAAVGSARPSSEAIASSET